MKSGYIIANEHEEFVAALKLGDGFKIAAWSPSPSKALVFRTKEHCIKAMMDIGTDKYSLWEMTIKETKTQFIVGCSCDVFPPWFSSE
jgi:hypothetical protein